MGALEKKIDSWDQRDIEAEADRIIKHIKASGCSVTGTRYVQRLRNGQTSITIKFECQRPADEVVVVMTLP